MQMLLAIWNKSESEVNQILRIQADHNPYNARRIGEAKNPGPQLKLVTINSGGSPGAWRALDHYASASLPGVIAIQEASMTSKEWSTFQRKAAQKNYIGYYQPGTMSRNSLVTPP